MNRFITLRQLKHGMLRNKEFRDVYFDSSDIAQEIGEQVVEARMRAGITQKKLAKLIGTKQTSIARLENGNDNRLPSLSFLKKIADALNFDIEFRFVPKYVNKNLLKQNEKK